MDRKEDSCKKLAIFALGAASALALSGCSGISPDRLVPKGVKPSTLSDRVSNSVPKIKLPGFLTGRPVKSQPTATVSTGVPVVPSVPVSTFRPPVVNPRPLASGQVLAAQNRGTSAIERGDVLALPQRVTTNQRSTSVSPDTGLPYVPQNAYAPRLGSVASSGAVTAQNFDAAQPSQQTIQIAPLNSSANTVSTTQYGAPLPSVQVSSINPNSGYNTDYSSSQVVTTYPQTQTTSFTASPSGQVSSAVTGEAYASLQPSSQRATVSEAPRTLTGAKPQVALLLPTGASGGIGQVAQQMRNAALLSRDDGGSTIDLKFYDTGGTTSAARSATAKAIKEGAGLILGPLMGSNVNTVYSAAQNRGVNIVSFSNDTSKARPGAFLLGLGPDQSIERIISYAAGRGLRRIAVLAPQSTYGRRALQKAQSTAFANGATIVGPFTYNAASGSDERKSAAKAVAEAEARFDAILIADNAKSSREMAALLLFNQVDLNKKQVLGTDLWNDSGVEQEVGLRGALYATTNDQKWQSFQSRYRSRFGSSPEKVAGIAYDAVQMASRLASNRQYTSSTLTSSAGGDGLFGAYRLSASGRNIRALDIRRVGQGSSVVVEQAARFAGL